MNIFRSGTNFDHRPADCAICQDDFAINATNNCLRLKCGHIFHRVCVEQWISEHKSCPFCRKFSILSIPESVENILNGIKRPIIKALMIGLTIGATFLSIIGIIKIIDTARRAFQNLPLLATAEENLKLREAVYQHNLKFGYNYHPHVITGKQLVGANIFIPVALAAGTGACLFAKYYFKNRIIMDRNSAILIDYIPPTVV